MGSFWEYGHRAKIAKLLKVKPSHLSEILHRKRGVDKERAKQLETISEDVLGYPVPWEEWLFNKTSKHPAFFGKPNWDDKSHWRGK